jgi:hypothetical protein
MSLRASSTDSTFRPSGGVQEHDDEGRDAAVADHAADDARGWTAVERRVDDFDQLRRRALSPAVEVRVQLAADLPCEGLEVGDQAGERQVRQQLAHRALQRIAHRVHAIGTLPEARPDAVTVNSICSSTPTVANRSRVIELKNVQ